MTHDSACEQVRRLAAKQPPGACWCQDRADGYVHLPSVPTGAAVWRAAVNDPQPPDEGNAA